jgi:peptidase M23-like protein
VVAEALAAVALTCPAPAYDWPVRPFERAHPVRGGLNDPRGGRSFHFGVDITARDGTPVYAVAPGRARVRGNAVTVDSGCRSFAYWHVVPLVQSGRWVRRHQRLGRVQRPYAHVHFAEHDGRGYVDPTRPGRAGLRPYWDRTRPVIERVARTSGGGLFVQTHDLPAIRSPRPWRRFRVTPARIGWRLITAGGREVRPFRWAYLGHRKLADRRYASVFAPGTRENRPGRPGVYRFWLTRRLAVPAGRYLVRVTVLDRHGNTSRRSVRIVVGNEGAGRG